MWNQWKIFEKITKDLNHVLFWGLKWPRNWASEAIIQHISKSSSNWHVNQDWCETSGKILRKWPKTGIFTYLGGGPKWPKIGPLRPIFSTHLKLLAMSMWSNTDVKSSHFTTFGATLLCTLKPKMGKIGWKLREPIPIWKKVDGQMDGQTDRQTDRWLSIRYAPLIMSAAELKNSNNLITFFFSSDLVEWFLLAFCDIVKKMKSVRLPQVTSNKIWLIRL